MSGTRQGLGARACVSSKREPARARGPGRPGLGALASVSGERAGLSCAGMRRGERERAGWAEVRVYADLWASASERKYVRDNYKTKIPILNISM